MSSYSPRPLGSRFATTLRAFTAADGLPLAQALPEEAIDAAAAAEGVAFPAAPACVYTPALTLWAWLGQCLSGSKSCVAAVARVMVLCVALGRAPCAAY